MPTAAPTRANRATKRTPKKTRAKVRHERRVELERDDRQAPAPDLGGARPGGTQLDPRPLQREQVLDRLRHRTEAVAKLVAQRPQLSGAARCGDPAMDIDLRRLEGNVV